LNVKISNFLKIQYIGGSDLENRKNRDISAINILPPVFTKFGLLMQNGVTFIFYRGQFIFVSYLITPLTVSCFSKIQIGFTFLVPTHPAVVLGKGPRVGSGAV